MKILVNIIVVILNIACIVFGSCCNTWWSLCIVCIISTVLLLFNTIANMKLETKVDRHEKALTLSGDDLE